MWSNIKKFRFQFFLLIIALVLFSAIAGHIYQVSWASFFNEFGNKDRPFYLVNIAIALAAIATAIFTWWKNTISKEQVEVAQRQTEEQIKQTQNLIRQTDNAQRQTENLIEQTKNAQRQIELQEDTRLDYLYAKAIEFLNQRNDPITRKGGIHILKDLAITSPKHTQKCIDMLCSLNEVWMPFILNQNINFFIDENYDWLNRKVSLEDLEKKFMIKNIDTNYEKKEWLLEEISVSQSVLKEIVNIIQHINQTEEGLEELYDMSYKYLCSIKLNAINLTNFKTNNINFTGANIEGCDLQTTDFSGSNFEGSKIYSTKFQDSELNECNFTSVKFFGVKLQSADIFKSTFRNATIKNCTFDSSDLSDCNFENSYVEKSFFLSSFAAGAVFEGASLHDCNFSEADLSRCNLNGTFLYWCKFFGAHMGSTNVNSSLIFYSKFQGSDLNDASLDSSCILNTQFQGSNLMNISLDYSIWLNSGLLGAFIKIDTPQKILSNDKLFSGDEIFEKKADAFDNWLKEETKKRWINMDDSKNDFLATMKNAYTQYAKIKEKFKTPETLEIIKTPDVDFIRKRNEFSLQLKYFAKRMYESYHYEGHPRNSVLSELLPQYEKFLKNSKPDWYKEFEETELYID